MLNRLATKKSSKIICNNATTRSYAVVAQTPKAYDTSKEVFKAASPLQSLWSIGSYEDRLISLLSAIRPYKITPEFVNAANEVLNKQYKTADIIPKEKTLDFAKCIQGVDTIELDEHTLTAYYGEDYKDILQEFFELKPSLSQRAMDRYLQLNAAKYEQIKKERAERILAWCRETAKKL
ncbi:hypothetical protein C9374_001681 [Naegleria lovaniensis]|uniref:Uncharacterized protein n=1 Tax=Naegleria lovaniensis TaxID=51637 RepID=A0AA88GX80_NAELO|nr:uncharacterized protein C9374_001681 [Naegleria lovaniensis]KAG2387349.1 hypothetical protein C9374_001681 [Naegleria lovaniensis]